MSDADLSQQVSKIVDDNEEELVTLVKNHLSSTTKQIEDLKAELASLKGQSAPAPAPAPVKVEAKPAPKGRFVVRD